MTRVNVGIHPRELPTKLLLAEHREIKRIPNLIMSKAVDLTKIPNLFTLGTGHVRFFYNKQKYLFNRYMSIYEECLVRNLSVHCYKDSFERIPNFLWNDYFELERDRKLIIDRIHSHGFILLSE